MGTSGVQKKLRPLFNTNMPPISEKYGLRNHFPPLQRSFLMRKCEKKGLLKKSLSSRFYDIFGIAFQFLRDWLKRNFRSFFYWTSAKLFALITLTWCSMIFKIFENIIPSNAEFGAIQYSCANSFTSHHPTSTLIIIQRLCHAHYPHMFLEHIFQGIWKCLCNI